MNSPVVAPPPMPKSAVTAEERTRVIDFTKTQVLPDANSSALIKCEKNNATRVLAAAIYSVLEKKFFDTVLPRADVATAFHCNTSQLSKALTGIEYASGPHQYTPKKSATKSVPPRKADSQQQPKLKRKQQWPAEMILYQHRVRATATHRFRMFFFKQKSKRRANLLLLTFNTYLIYNLILDYLYKTFLKEFVFLSARRHYIRLRDRHFVSLSFCLSCIIIIINFYKTRVNHG